MALAEHELAERDRRRIERHLVEAKLLPGKTLCRASHPDRRATDLTEVHRQRHGWQKDVAGQLAKGQTREALEAYDSRQASASTREAARVAMA
jgi:hypothetical protein